MIMQKVQIYLSKMRKWGQERIVRPYFFGVGGCRHEMKMIEQNLEDLYRMGIDFTGYAPENSDVLIISGPVTHKQFPELYKTYLRMPEPKWVIAFGTCSGSSKNCEEYNMVTTYKEKIPVDLTVVGCPPTEAGLIEAIIKIQDMIKSEKDE